VNIDVVIPARGGSRGVPRKNLLRVGGVPLVARAVVLAQRAVDGRVLVSTEDDEIAGVAHEYGAEIIHRPMELATDTATSESVLMHACTAARLESDILCLVQCTAPLMTSDDIRGTVWTLTQGGDSAVCCEASDALLATMCRGMTGRWSRRQNRPPTHIVNGTCWAFWRTAFLNQGTRYMIPMETYLGSRRLEIDTPEDWAIVQALDAAGLIPSLEDGTDGRRIIETATGDLATSSSGRGH